MTTPGAGRKAAADSAGAPWWRSLALPGWGGVEGSAAAPGPVAGRKGCGGVRGVAVDGARLSMGAVVPGTGGEDR